MRQKFTKLDHEMVITDSTGLQQVYPMPWSNETGQWTLDTSSNMVQCFSEIFTRTVVRSRALQKQNQWDYLFSRKKKTEE